MDREAELAIVRQAYARQILALTDIADPRRTGETYEARKRLPMAIIPAEGVLTEAAEAALAAAFERDVGATMTRLIRHKPVADEECWLRGDGWTLVRD